MSRDVLVKATPLRTLRGFMDDHLSPDAVQKVFDRVAGEFPNEAREFRSRPAVPSERVPVIFVNRLIELTADELREPATAVAHRVGRRGAEEASTGLMKLAMVLISMPNLLRKLAPVWSQLYSHGKMNFTADDKSAVVELTEYPVLSKTGCARVTGWFEWFAQKAEKNATVRHVACRAEGGDVCRWKLTWS